jgi:hypothetical protein
VLQVFSAPLWLVALALAAAAPFCVGALQSVLELQLRRRTAEALSLARAIAESPDPTVSQRRAGLRERGGGGEVRLLAVVEAVPAADETDPREEG